MSNTLETLLDKYLKLEEKILFRENAVPNEKEAYVDAIKKQLSDKIYEEIKQEILESVLADAEEIIEKKAGLKRIEEFKKLSIDGLIVAFFVGLLVNQSTDIIGYFKGSFFTNNIWLTVGVAVVLLLICVGIFVGLFISELIKLLRKDKHENGWSRKSIYTL